MRAVANGIADPASILVTQGEFAVDGRPETRITTILGSCVAVCLWSPEARIGGMNHILLPDDGGGTALRFGASDMERLINAIQKHGILRSTLRAKLFGGAAIVQGLSDIGERNIAFARGFLKAEGIAILAESIGGTRPRQIRFWPHTGKAQVRFVGDAELAEERPVHAAPGSEVELFGD
jgi:chemotaxis protein CheD